MEYSNYQFLSELGIKKSDNHSVFDGFEWKATGEKYMSINPNTN